MIGSDIVIVGNGVAGITTARHIRKHGDVPITVISAETKYFYSRTALMYIYMGHMKFEHTKPYEDWFWEKNRIDLIQDLVEKVDTDNKTLQLHKGGTRIYDKLVLATGAKTNYFNWPGQDLKGVQGLYGIPDLTLLEKNTLGARKAVIIGGGLIGVELAEMLHSRGIAVTFLIRETHFWGNIMRAGEGHLIGRHLATHGVEIKTETQLAKILPDSNGRCRAVVTDKGEEIACDFVGLTAGVHPNTDLVADTPIETGRGIVVNSYLETNVADVYAAGDCAQIRDEDGPGRVEQLWYTGKMQGEALAKTICGERTRYERGIWFNSAKFFDIEYHTYGYVAQEPQADEDDLFWENAAADKCMRLVFKKDGQRLVGMNAFGIRYKHRVFERWLDRKSTLKEVLGNLGEANFDPEFFKRFEHEIVALYNRQYPNQALKQPQKRRLLGIF